ncbi:MAG: flavodoxin family protein [Campylobacter sp.]|nr:flavodoxin family protein [Campylobacter sp.]
MKKVIIINASPRKNFNTAEVLKSSEKGAQSVGAQTEFINLGDVDFKGCISCFVCKKRAKV